ncbi:hypothetical protein Q1695_009302 [Nippostrongylus brasiliensis]|nr:hypothetical protein Q1695_009302 [Nippostrongylus brasiliensis]
MVRWSALRKALDMDRRERFMWLSSITYSDEVDSRRPACATKEKKSSISQTLCPCPANLSDSHCDDYQALHDLYLSFKKSWLHHIPGSTTCGKGSLSTFGLFLLEVLYSSTGTTHENGRRMDGGPSYKPSY